MPIRFPCPHCHKILSVKEHLVGKKGPCPSCKRVLTVPAQAGPSTGITPRGLGGAGGANASPPGPRTLSRGPAPDPGGDGEGTPRIPETPGENGARHPSEENPDVEDAAAALLGDGAGEQEAQTTVDFPCPFCDEPIQVSAELAGKRHPCPECRNIVRVPHLEKKDDWRGKDHLPSGAKREQTTLEGAWGAQDRSTVSEEALEEAGAIPDRYPGMTRQQKIILASLGVGMFLLLSLSGWFVWSWWAGNARDKQVSDALAYANSTEGKKALVPAGRAMLHLKGSAYYLSDDPIKARDQLGKALALLIAPATPKNGNNDIALLEVAREFVELGGVGLESGDERQGWRQTQRALRSALLGMSNAQARLEALLLVCRKLLSRGDDQRALALANQVYSRPDVDQAEALASLGLEMLDRGQRERANNLLTQALVAYKDKNTQIRPAVLGLALALDKKPPKVGEGAGEQAKAQVGKVIGLTRKKKWDQALQQANEIASPRARFQAIVEVGEASIKASAGSAALENGFQLANRIGPNRLDDWTVYRLVRLAIQAGLDLDKIQPATRAIGNPGLRGGAQLLVFRAKLTQSREPLDESVVKEVEPESVAHALARLELAQHNVRRDSGWASTARGWDAPYGAFGMLGVAIGQSGKSKS